MKEVALKTSYIDHIIMLWYYAFVHLIDINFALSSVYLCIIRYIIYCHNQYYSCLSKYA